ncbi:hypothetical protein LDENG_00173020 [Lucifuga dentata]|nr:hypothetical protein LDENG_00173020 [Lucifuga dentata]
MTMLRFSLGISRMDKIKNEYIRGTAQVRWFRDKAREARLRWFGHVQRRDAGYIGRMLKMELPGKRKRGWPKRRFIDVVRGHAGGWCNRGRCRGQGEMETDDPLW